MFLSGDTFEMRLAVKPDVDFPTMPTIRVYAVIGFPKVPEYDYDEIVDAFSLQTTSTAMRRFDHAPFFSMQKSEYTIPFYVKV